MKVKVYWDFSKGDNDHTNDTVEIHLTYDEYLFLERAALQAWEHNVANPDNEFKALYMNLGHIETYEKSSRKKIR